MVHLPTALFSLSYIRDSSNRRSHYAPCGARRDFLATDELADLISIHAPLAGRDHYRRDNRYLRRDFNPRAPCGARHNWYGKIGVAEQDFNPRAPCGARPVGSLGGMGYAYFNPRAPCGARPYSSMIHCTSVRFQSTRPLRGATVNFTHKPSAVTISIHAPLAGRDEPRLARLRAGFGFQSTRPLRGATRSIASTTFYASISIHAPLAGRDLFGYADFTTPIIFQSTRPLRGATLSVTRLPMAQCHFNPRAPCGARPPPCLASCATSHISIHAPLAGRDRFPRVRQC